MIKPQTKKTITLETIIEAFEKHSVEAARSILYDRIGATLSITATVEKTIRRDGGLKLLLNSNNSLNGENFRVFADFNDEIEQNEVKARKVKKRSKISLTGDFRTAGYAALTMSNCRLNLIS